MNSAEKADKLIAIAQIRTTMWKGRVDTSWKLSLALWALLAAAAHYVQSKAVAIYLGPFIFAAHTYLNVMISARTRRELSLITSYIREVERLALAKPISPVPGNPNVIGFRDWLTIIFNYSIIMQSVATLMLIVAIYILGK